MKEATWQNGSTLLLPIPYCLLPVSRFVMSDTQQEKAEELAEAFQMFDAWDDRYTFLMDLGRQLPPMPEATKPDF